MTARAATNLLLPDLEWDDSVTAETLFPVLYRELHRLAHSQLMSQAPGATLGTTTLLHEAYLDLSKAHATFPTRGHFFSYAAQAMRGLVIDYIRERRATKRGGEYHLVALNSETTGVAAEQPPLALRLKDALAELTEVDPALAELVDLKYFCGFTFADIATFRDAGERTVQRDWAKAKLLLFGLLQGD
jgi:RNA polymerase sigma factor (TIGR02999 family)